MLRTILFVLLACHFEAAGQNYQEIFAPLKYRNVGPTRGGRVTAVAGHPSTPHIFFMGATGGGVWKTRNYGQSWENISDGYFASPSIGDIAIAPSDHSVLYVGTGSDGIRSNVIIGKGVYKSENGGSNWKFSGLSNVGQIGAVLIHPADVNKVYVAAIGNPFSKSTSRGIYVTHDGGSTWKQSLFLSDSVGAVDLEFCPGKPNIIYASMWRAERKPWTIISGGMQTGGLYKSNDGGESWKKLTAGLPQGLIGKSDLAVSPDQPNWVWALVEAPAGEGGVFLSKDQGENFELVNTKKELLDRPFYYCNIDANPQNANSLYVSATRYWHSTDGGKTWSRVSTPHGDNHGVWINPDDTLLQIQCNDGGANVTRDGGETWSSILNQPTAELYQVAIDDQFPYWLYAGQQDNSTIAVPSLPPHNPPGGPQAFWMAVGGCETGPAVPKPGDPDIVYSNCKGRFGVFNKRTGQEKHYYVGAANMYGQNPRDLTFRFQRVSPIHVSPHDPDIIYHTSQFVHMTKDEGQSWMIISPDLTAFTPETQVISGHPITRDITGEEFYSTIYSIRESPVAAGQIWTGANDGPVYLTTDMGTNWQEVTPGSMPKGGRVDCVEPSPHNSRKAYIAGYRYLLGDFHPYLYKTQDLGQSWQLISDGKNGIPADAPTRVIREDPFRAGLLYAGTDNGIYISFDDGQEWHAFQQNLPITPITEIVVTERDLVISTMGRSFWIMDDVAVLRQLSLEVQTTLFHPGKAYRMRYQQSSDIPTYPVPGLNIHYFLEEEPVGDVKLEIYNVHDQLVRTFSSSVKEDSVNVEEDMATGFGFQQEAVEIEKEPGMHRMRWDLRHQGIQNLENRPIRGPLVSPGNYRFDMTIGDKRYIQLAEILIDPRAEKEGLQPEDLIKQEALSLDILQLRKQAQEVASQISALSAQKQSEPEITEIREQLITADGRYQVPALIDQISYLYNMLDRADQLPGKDAYDRYASLKKQLDALQNSLPSQP
ncbi:MAG: hypothetical protein OEM26_13195 [Saprospiraceae bacterium]|nr:hypothetical protein [Saprospiraceae bacterium]